jgi:hypothetical protein
MADIASPLDLARQAVAAAKTAADEGEAILRHTQERYRLNLHATEAQAERPRLPKPKLIIKPEPELPEYVLTAADRVNVAAVVAMMKTAHAAKSAGLRKAAYRDVGIHLQELRHNRDQAELATILWHECGLSLPRAYQLMTTLATGTKRLDQLHSEDRGRHRKLQASLAICPHQEQRRSHG